PRCSASFDIPCPIPSPPLSPLFPYTTLFRSYVVHEDIAQGRLLTALEQWRLSIFGRSMYLLYMPSRHHPRALAMLIEFILAKARSEEHTSELQSRENLVCRLLLEKKK